MKETKNNDGTIVVLDFENIEIGLRDKKEKWIEELNYWINEEFDPLRKVVFLDSHRINGKRDLLDKCNWSMHDVVTREKDEKEKELVRNNAIDIELGLYTLDYIYRNNIDRVVLISGDGDYASLVNYLRRNHVSVVVVSLLSCLSNKLDDAADDIYSLEKILDFKDEQIEVEAPNIKMESTR